MRADALFEPGLRPARMDVLGAAARAGSRGPVLTGMRPMASRGNEVDTQSRVSHESSKETEAQRRSYPSDGVECDVEGHEEDAAVAGSPVRACDHRARRKRSSSGHARPAPHELRRAAPRRSPPSGGAARSDAGGTSTSATRPIPCAPVPGWRSARTVSSPAAPPSDRAPCGSSATGRSDPRDGRCDRRETRTSRR